MSLKAIKEALDLLAVHIEDNGPCDHAVNICSCGERQTLADAKDQIAALEKAAKAMKRMTIAVPQDLLTTDEAEAIDTMCTIAKGAE